MIPPCLLDNGGSLGPATLSWVSSAYADIRIVDMVYGSWPMDTARSAVAHVVITEQRARELGYAGPDAVGQVMHYTTRDDAGSGDIRIDPLRSMIIDGVAATTTNAFDSTSILIVSDLPRPELFPEFGGMSWLARVNEIDQGTLQNLVSSVTDETGAPLFQSQRIDQSAQLAPVLDQQAVTARVVTLVALTVGGLGILGVGLASVRERGKDFGLRRALGASKLRIFEGVIVQTLLELYARDLVLDRLPLPASTALPVSSAALGLAGALLVGLVAGLIPAFSAARASVVQALKG